MEKIENEKNGLMQNQKSLYKKLIRINQLFKIHFSSLIMFFLFSLGFAVLWTYLLAIGHAITDLIQRYGVFGTIMTIIMITVLFGLIVQIGFQIIFYGLFLLRGNRALKQDKCEKIREASIYDGIVPYVSNFYEFFNRFSKEKVSVIKLVYTFLFFNFISGFFIVFLLTRFLDTGNTNIIINICIIILFITTLVFWLINLMTSLKIRKEIVKWEKLFPKLEEWAQELEEISPENSIFSDKEDPL